MNEKYSSGMITKAVGGSYDVTVGDDIIHCAARGIFRKKGISPCAGDNVKILMQPGEAPVICEIAERKNHLIRPPLSNLDKALIVASSADPAPNPYVIDKLISIFEIKKIEPVIVFTKSDIQSCDELAAVYRGGGFTVIFVDNITGDGCDLVKAEISGKVSALIGNSGVGKSSLMNVLFPELNITTGDISKKLGRGRHTTRQAELYPLPDGGYIADTPGFSTVEISRYGFVPKEMLQYSFREFSDYIGKCRFNDCAHLKEKDCAVLSAADSGKISASRYSSYVKMYEEAEKLNDWEFKNQ